MTLSSAAVVVVNYRSYDELERCFASLEADRTSIAEAVVVDHDTDVARALGIADRFPWARVLPTSDNEGFAAGVNRGARETRAPFLLLINPDCELTPGAAARLLAFLSSNPDTGVVGPKILNRDGSVQGSARRFPGVTAGFAGRNSWLTRMWPANPFSRWNIHASEQSHTSLDVDWVSGACMLVRREAFEQIGGMDEGFFLYWEDADLCRRLEHAGWRTVYVPAAVAIHAGARSSRYAADASLAAFHRSAFRLFWKHASPAARLFSPVVFLALQTHLAVQRLSGRSGPSGTEA